MAAIAFSLFSFIFGQPLEETSIELWGAADGVAFWQVFAVFFPAVTGIMAGVNMSGDLRDPIRSIPMGTLAAVGTGYVIYMGLPFLLATRADAQTLIENPLVMQQMALWGPAILVGIWGATLSSAIGSILGAPRVLQALARDGVLPRWMSFFGKGSGPDDELRLGTIVTLGVVVAAVSIGDLNLIAPILTMFFLTTYLVLNVSAGIESFLQSPSFRPLFKVHWSISLIGTVGCLGVMFLINPTATMAAAFIVLSIYLWLQRRGLQTTWGDVRRGIWMMLIRTGLFQVGHEQDTKNWRPHILVLSGSPTRRWPLIALANALTQNRGLITVASVLPSGSRDMAQQEALEETLSDYLNQRGIQALVRTLTAPDPFEGAQRLVEIYGLGTLVPNTILLGDSEDPSKRYRYCQLITQLHQAKRNILILRHSQDNGFGVYRRIDIWWGGMNANVGLMLLLAHLLGSSIDWNNAQICLKLVVPNAAAAAAARTNLKGVTESLRIKAISQVLTADERPFNQILHQSSADADLVLLGMATPRPNFTHYYESLQRLTAGLPTTLLALAAPDFMVAEVLTSS